MSGNTARFFPASYDDGRRNFREAARTAGARLEEHINPNARGPAGERLATDVARIGAEDASKVLIINSATHGVEGFCGSGIQNGLLRTYGFSSLPADIAVVFVHAINPYGFAHVRRVTEENVDLNRNFVDHDAGHPGNPAYDEIHALLVPADYGPAKEAADAAMMRYVAERGLKTLQAAVTGGQYDHADGLFYGGRAPTWSNRMWRTILDRHARGVRSAAFIDVHTGLGPYGYGEPIYSGVPGDATHDRALAWYGKDVTATEDGSSTSARVGGHLGLALKGVVSDGAAVAIALEYGTRPVMDVLEALRADNWLYLHGDVNSELGRAIKAQIRDALYPDEPRWKTMVFARALDFMGRAISGMQALG